MFRSRVESPLFRHFPKTPVALPQVRSTRDMDESRVRAGGKFLFVGEQKLYVRGVTYGPFRPSAAGEYHARGSVAADFSRIADAGFNAVRLYTVPPRWLLDEAQEQGLYAMVGLPWEQHIAFLDRRGRASDIVRRVREGVEACAGHPAVLCYAIGNEIPTYVVRWYGHERVERFLSRLYDAAKGADPSGLVTYVNYPSTEYLDLPFLDLTCFNVYLDSAERLKAYVGRLQNIAGNRPLLMGELGLDSMRAGERAQAELLPAQLRVTFDRGCAGAFVFSWTDEWHRGGHDIEDWGFGLTRRDREGKPALAAVTRAMEAVPFAGAGPWPRISVIVCTYNGRRTIGEVLEGLRNVDYPDFEVIVVDDGSTDGTDEIVRGHDVRLIRTANHGLSHARNVGLRAATGEIVAYLDDDAWPDLHWLRYLANSFLTTRHAGIGGPNLTPLDDGAVARCVGVAPGGPTHVLLTDDEAEHIPGCNMAFRRTCLEAIGGFDEQFHTAGDDVDVCWRIQERGWSLGFNPSAVVWHRRRRSVRAYWRQQVNYGRAEAVLERKWPEKYNAAGHAVWNGRLYGGAHLPILFWSRRRRIYHGVWGNALFQSVYHVSPGWMSSLPLMPEWFLLIAVLVLVSALGFLSPPLFVAAPLAGLAVLVSLVQAVRRTGRAVPPVPRSAHWPQRVKLRALVAWLHVIQPVARLAGRSHFGLTPWRGCRGCGWAAPVPRRFSVWSECWEGVDERLTAFERGLRQTGAVVVRGGEFDRWDIEVRGGLFGSARLRMLIEEHGSGKQLVRLLVWPHVSVLMPLFVLPLLGLCGVGTAVRSWTTVVALALPAALIAVQTLREVAAALAAASKPVEDIRA